MARPRKAGSPIQPMRTPSCVSSPG